MRRRLLLAQGLGWFGGAALAAPVYAQALGESASSRSAQGAARRLAGLQAERQAQAARLAWQETALPMLGTTAWLRVGHPDAAVAQAAVQAAVAELRAVDDAANLFRADSAIVRLNRDGGLDDLPPMLHRLLSRALDVAAGTGGRFDPTVQPLWRLWADAAAAGLRPEAGAVRAARRLARWEAVRVEGSRVRLRAGMALTLNGIAQGFAADRARAVLGAHGIEHALIDSGEWQPLGRAPDGGPWTLGVAAPDGSAAPGGLLARLRGDGRAIAASADDTFRFSADGRDHHILDPSSGYSPRVFSRVVVAAPRAALADALTKPLMLAPDAATALKLANLHGADALVVERSGRWQASRGMPLAV